MATVLILVQHVKKYMILYVKSCLHLNSFMTPGDLFEGGLKKLNHLDPGDLFEGGHFRGGSPSSKYGTGWAITFCKGVTASSTLFGEK